MNRLLYAARDGRLRVHRSLQAAARSGWDVGVADRLTPLPAGTSLMHLPGRIPLGLSPAGATVAVEVKRRGEIDGVEQLTRYLELLGRDPLLAPVSGIFAAQEIKPQARVLAQDRGIRCVVVDYDSLRGVVRDELTLF